MTKKVYYWHGSPCQLLARPRFLRGVKRNALIEFSPGYKLVVPFRSLRTKPSRFPKMQRFCAWCRRYLGEIDGKGQSGTTHSICPECKAKNFPETVAEAKGGQHDDRM